ncbi:ead/Ea22-like family protein [Klebsiella variicola]
MTDITELTAEKLEEIRQRYRPTLAPKCHICGVEMTIQRMSASRITYGCAGAFYDETGCHYAEGRSLADDHYAESRITVVDVSDPDVLAMVEALEKAQAENTAGVAGMAESYETTISMLRSRIADLESRTVTVKLPQAVSAGGQGYQEQVERILTAAGIKVEAE